MTSDLFSILGNPIFVVPWYGFGLVAGFWVLFDEVTANKGVNEALKIGWPIVISFFSIIGLVLYLWTCRPPGIVQDKGEEADNRHHAYVSPKWKRVTGSVIHCVAGDGLGIVTAMVVARLLGFSFWKEFGYEYAVGFAFGWFIFQTLRCITWGIHWLHPCGKGGAPNFFR